MDTSLLDDHVQEGRRMPAVDDGCPSGNELDRTVIIGVGNEFRADDALGLAIVRELRGILPEDAVILEQSGEGARLMQAWEDAERVVIIDAVRSGAPAGTIHRINLTREQIPTCLSVRSSHQFGVAEAVSTARALGRLPRRALLIGIEALSLDHGTSISEPVQSALPLAIDLILRELNTHISDTERH